MWFEMENMPENPEEKYDYTENYTQYREILSSIDILPKDYPWLDLVANLYALPVWDKKESVETLRKKYLDIITIKKNLNHVPSDIAVYMFMLLEYYRQEHQLTRKEAIKEFLCGNIFDYLGDHFAILHTEANQRVLGYIEERIERAKILEGNIVDVKKGDELGYPNCKVVIIKNLPEQ